MNPILFKVLIFFTIPPDQIKIFENFAVKYDISVELMLEQYIMHKLEIDDCYVEVELEEE